MSAEGRENPIRVAAAAIRDPSGRVLLSRRADHLHQGGLWEFPGGKLEAGEGPEEALARELREELGIEVLASRPLISVRHDYGDRIITLLVFEVTAFSGEPRSLEGQPLAWVASADLGQYPLPAADRPIVTALALPRHYTISGQDPSQPAAFLARLHRRVEQGARLIQLRAPQLSPAAYTSLAREALEICHQGGAALLLNAPLELAQPLDADGLHLNSRQLLALQQRPTISGRWLAASCHNQAELRKAVQLGVDFAVLSPVLPTASHPQATPLGWDGFGRLVDGLPMPIFALGGMGQQHLSTACNLGGQGIAAIGSLW